MLEIEAREESREEPGAVIRLPDVLSPIPEASISDQKIVAAALKVGLMDTGDSARREFRGSGVERAAPSPAVNRNPPGSQAINGGERETLRLPVIPAQHRKHPDVLVQLLVHAQPESIFQGPVAARVSNNRSSTTPFGLPHRLGVVTRVG